MRINNKNNNGITLVALIVTIIILLILAGITIQQLTGSGLFEKARQASLESKYANAAEKVALAVNASYDTTGSLNDNYLKENLNKIDGINEPVETVTYDLKVIVDGFKFTISEYGIITGDRDAVVGDGETKLPENSKENPQDAGTKVALKDGWGTQHVTYVKTSDGTDVKTLETVSTVYAVSVGNGETVPIPQGFYYVGGNLKNGVIISDKEADKYDGTTDKTTYAYTTSLKGNQFVLIPCTTSEYKKSNKWNNIDQTSSSLGVSWWDTKTPASELTQIEKYGGFYVARYEAGLASSITEFDKDQKNGSNQIYNESGIPQSKAGIIPWIFIDWNTAKSNAQSMYSGSQYVNSGLITGTQWDVMLKKMVGKTIGETTGDSEITLTEADLTDSSRWGNYKNTKIPYKGRLSKVYFTGGNWYVTPFETEKTGTTSDYTNIDKGDLLTTGASKATQVYHIYDVAGNLWEWTEETSFSRR